MDKRRSESREAGHVGLTTVHVQLLLLRVDGLSTRFGAQYGVGGGVSSSLETTLYQVGCAVRTRANVQIVRCAQHTLRRAVLGRKGDKLSPVITAQRGLCQKESLFFCCLSRPGCEARDMARERKSQRAEGGECPVRKGSTHLAWPGGTQCVEGWAVTLRGAIPTLRQTKDWLYLL